MMIEMGILDDDEGARRLKKLLDVLPALIVTWFAFDEPGI